MKAEQTRPANDAPDMTDQRKGIMRSLGEFVGHIARGLATDPAKPRVGERTVVREDTTQSEETTADGRRVILRRTVIEEIEVAPDAAGTERRPEDGST